MLLCLSEFLTEPYGCDAGSDNAQYGADPHRDRRLVDRVRHPDAVDISSGAASRRSRTSRRGNTPGSTIDGWTAPALIGAHSLCRTKPAQIYKKMGNLRAVQLLLDDT